MKRVIAIVAAVLLAASVLGAQEWPGNGGKLHPFDGQALIFNQAQTFSTLTMDYPALAATPLYNARIGTTWSFGFFVASGEQITAKPFVSEAAPLAAPLVLPTHVTRFQQGALTWLAQQGLYPFDDQDPNNGWIAGRWLSAENAWPVGRRDVLGVVIDIPNDTALIGFRFYVEWLYGPFQGFKFGPPSFPLQPSLEAPNAPTTITGSGGGFTEVVIGA